MTTRASLTGTSGLYDDLGYDYKGNLVTDSNGSIEHRYQRDCQGRLMAETTESGGGTTNWTATLNTCTGPGRCGCSGGSNADTKLEEILWMLDDDLELLVFSGRMQYIYGMGLASPGSTNTPHPDTAGMASLGDGVGGMIVAEYRFCVVGEFAGHLWNYENQHGSLMGQADANGDRTVEFDYSDYGLTLERPILIDGRTGNISSTAHDGTLNITSVTFTNGLPSATILGAEVRVAGVAVTPPWRRIQ